MRLRRARSVAACVVLSLSSVVAVAPAQAADEVGPPQPEAVVMTRTCEQNGALVAMNNFGGGSVTFNVLVDNEASGTYAVTAGATANHLVPIMEDQTVAIQVTADGMAPVTATRTRDCEATLGAAEGPGGSDAAVQGATDPVDSVPAGTPPPEPVPPTAVAGASEAPADTSDAAGTSDPTLAPADPTAPTGTLPFTGAANVTWVAGAGMALVLLGALAWRPRRERVSVRSRSSAR